MPRRPRDILPPYRHSLAGTLLAAREAVMAPIRPMLRAANVTEQQWRVLRVLADGASLDSQTLAAAALLHTPSVTRITKELAERGLIERRIDRDDGRRSNLGITAAGLALVQATASHTLQVLDAYAEAFGAERLAALRDEIAAFTAIVEQVVPDDAAPRRPVRGREPGARFGFLPAGLFRQVRDGIVAAAHSHDNRDD